MGITEDKDLWGLHLLDPAIVSAYEDACMNGTQLPSGPNDDPKFRPHIGGTPSSPWNVDWVHCLAVEARAEAARVRQQVGGDIPPDRSHTYWLSLGRTRLSTVMKLLRNRRPRVINGVQETADQSDLRVLEQAKHQTQQTRRWNRRSEVRYHHIQDP